MGLADDPYITEARKIRDLALSAIARMEQSGEHTELGLKRAAQPTRDRVNGQLAKLYEERQAAVKATAQRTEDEALNMVAVRQTSAIERRDAALRAEDLANPRDALKLLEQAFRHQDVALLAEVVIWAISRAWEDVVDCYEEMFPDRAAPIERYVRDRGPGSAMSNLAIRSIFRKV